MKTLSVISRFALSLVFLALGAAPAFATIHVDPAGSNADGTTWDSAYTSLTQAIAITAGGADHEIWVAEGDYAMGAQIDLAPGIQIYGGFGGLGGARETDPSQRDLASHPTTLHSSGGAIFVCNDHAGGVRLDGLIFTGVTQNSSVMAFGNGPDNVIANCQILDSTHGILAQTSTTLKIENSVFASISRDAIGGNDLFPAKSVTLTNCTINVAQRGFVADSPSTVTNTIFANCVYGVYLDASTSTPTLVSCLFSDNFRYAYNGVTGDAVTSLAPINALPGARDNIEGDPHFVNAAVFDFHLAEISAAVDQGSDALGTPADLEATARLDNPHYPNGPGGITDIGVYEGSPRLTPYKNAARDWRLFF